MSELKYDNSKRDQLKASVDLESNLLSVAFMYRLKTDTFNLLQYQPGVGPHQIVFASVADLRGVANMMLKQADDWESGELAKKAKE